MRILLFILLFASGCKSQNTSIGNNVTVGSVTGNIGIGTNSPQYTLDVNGTTYSKGLKVDSFLHIKLVAEGDSWNTYSTKWVAQLPDSFAYFAKASIINYAKSGDDVASMKGEYMTEAHLSRPGKGDEYWFSLYAGINDLASLNRPADSIYPNMKWIWAQARNDGFKVMAHTVVSSLYLTPTKEAERVKLNKLILSDASLYDICIDEAAVFNPWIDYSPFADQTHLSPAGFKSMAGTVANTFNYVPYNLTSAEVISKSPHSFYPIFKTGIILKRVTTAEKLLMQNIQEGLEVYDLTLHQKSYFNGTVWVNY